MNCRFLNNLTITYITRNYWVLDFVTVWYNKECNFSKKASVFIRRRGWQKKITHLVLLEPTSINEWVFLTPPLQETAFFEVPFNIRRLAMYKRVTHIHLCNLTFNIILFVYEYILFLLFQFPHIFCTSLFFTSAYLNLDFEYSESL